MLILGVYVAAQLIQANHSPFEHLNLTAKHSVLKLLVVFPLWFSFCAFTWCFLKQKSTLIISLFILGGIPLHFLDRATVYFNHRIKNFFFDLETFHYDLLFWISLLPSFEDILSFGIFCNSATFLFLIFRHAHYQTGNTPLALVWKDEHCSQYFLDTDSKGEVPALQQVQYVLCHSQQFICYRNWE